MAAPVTRSSLWSLIIGSVVIQIAGGFALTVGIEEDRSIMIILGSVALSVGSSLMLVGLIAFGVVLGSHVYRHERP